MVNPTIGIHDKLAEDFVVRIVTELPDPTDMLIVAATLSAACIAFRFATSDSREAIAVILHRMVLERLHQMEPVVGRA